MHADLLPWLVAGSVALAVLGSGWLAYGLFLKTQRKIVRQRRFARLEQMLTPGSEGDEAMREAEELTFAEKLVLFFSGRLPGGDTDSEDRRLLIQAGWRSLHALVIFQSLRWLAVAAVALGFVSHALFTGTLQHGLRGVALVILVFLGSRWLLRYLASRRLRQLADELPIFVDFLRMVHGVGVSFEQAIVLFANDSRLGLPILSSELAAVSLSIRSGRPRGEALQLMARQLDVDDLGELVALICHTDYYGAALQEPLRQFSARLTERKRFEMQEYVGKLATRMVIVMVLFLLPALMIVTAGPGFISVIRALGKMT